MLDIIHAPELACQVTMQPIDAFDLDAAIIFADILPPLGGPGPQRGLRGRRGPHRLQPGARRGRHQRPPRPGHPGGHRVHPRGHQAGPREQLDPRGIPLIGFSGAPFTLASYSVEGGSSKDFIITKRLMMGGPDLWQQLMEQAGRRWSGGYLRAQARGGSPGPAALRHLGGPPEPAPTTPEFALPYNRRVVRKPRKGGVPVIYFSTGTERHARARRPDRRRRHRRRLAHRSGGGLAAPRSRRRRPGQPRPGGLAGRLAGARRVAPRRSWTALPGGPGHIFNLGHGVLRETSVDSVRRLVDFVHEYRLKARLMSGRGNGRRAAGPSMWPWSAEASAG